MSFKVALAIIAATGLFGTSVGHAGAPPSTVRDKEAKVEVASVKRVTDDKGNEFILTAVKNGEPVEVRTPYRKPTSH